jgi:O-antigen/teichoic acid export membrane protein
MFLGIYYNFTVWFKLTDRTYYGTIITLGGAIITIVANYFLIPVAGYMGSSWATLICYFFMMLSCYWLGQKHYPIPYTIGKDTCYIILTIFMVYAIRSISLNNFWLAMVIHNTILLAFILIVFLIEKKSLKETIGRKW